MLAPPDSATSKVMVDESGFCPHCGVPVLPGQVTGSCGGNNALLIGNAAIARMGRDCCGKPQGCTNPADGCLYKGHPFKRHLYPQNNASIG